jgi:hypothetical protein
MKSSWRVENAGGGSIAPFAICAAAAIAAKIKQRYIPRAGQMQGTKEPLRKGDEWSVMSGELEIMNCEL